jgi:hypothetical protein
MIHTVRTTTTVTITKQQNKEKRKEKKGKHKQYARIGHNYFYIVNTVFLIISVLL